MPVVIDLLNGSSDDENQISSNVRTIDKTPLSRVAGSSIDPSLSRKTFSLTDTTNNTNHATKKRTVTLEKSDPSHDSSDDELHPGQTILEPISDRAVGSQLQGIRRCLNPLKFGGQGQSLSDNDAADDDSSVALIGIKTAGPLEKLTVKPLTSSPDVFDLCDSDDDSTGDDTKAATATLIHESKSTSDNFFTVRNEKDEQITQCEKQVDEVEKLKASTSRAIGDRNEVCTVGSTGDDTITAPFRKQVKKIPNSNKYNTGGNGENEQTEWREKQSAISSSSTATKGVTATPDSMSELEFTIDLGSPLGLVVLPSDGGTICVTKVKNNSQLLGKVFSQDIIYKIMNQHISTMSMLKRLLSRETPQQHVTLVVLRKQRIPSSQTDAKAGPEEARTVDGKVKKVASVKPSAGGVISSNEGEIEVEPTIGKTLVDRIAVGSQEKQVSDRPEMGDISSCIRAKQSAGQTKTLRSIDSIPLDTQVRKGALSPDMAYSSSSDSATDSVSIPSPSLTDEPTLSSSESDFSPEDHSANDSEDLSVTRNDFTENDVRPMRKQKREAMSYNVFENVENLESQLKHHGPRIAKERQCKNRSSGPKSSPRTSTKKLLVDDSNVIVMHDLRHLTKSTHPMLPSHRFTVHFPSVDWILYDFEIKIKPSQIDKNAGLGAFLIYHGGRRLEQSIDDRNQEKIAHKVASIPKTIKSLTGRSIDGSTAQITLTGKHLHGHNNSIFQAITETPMRARFGGKELSVTLTGEKLHYDSDEEDHLDLSCCPKRIGNLSLFIESDYRLERTIAFAPPRGKIAFLDIGRYGPVRKQDRKRKEDLDIKNFLFDNEPAGWCYGVEEQLLGSDQMIDITDDTTGELHDDAKKSVAPYVNEIGHNPKLTQNVHTRQKGDNCVNYYFAVDRELHAGDEVEMLADYDGPYEPTRERKGYGEKNLNGKTQSDDNAGSKLNRNCLERTEVEKLIKSMSPRELFYSLEFVISQIFPGVKKATDTCLDSGDEIPEEPAKVPSSRQLRARRRLHWIASLYIERSRQLTGCGLEEGNTVGANAVAEMMEKCNEWANQLFWDKIITLNPSLPNIADENLYKVFNEETIEELLYYIKDAVSEPLNLNLWCSLARDQTFSLCNIAYEQIRSSRYVNKERLADSFICCASDFAAKVRDAIRDKRYTLLSFNSGAERGKNFVDGQQKNLVTLAAGPVLSNSFVLKGAISALLDIQDHYDAIGHKEKAGISLMKRSCDDPVLIVKTNLGSNIVDGMPRRIDFVQNGRGEINEAWYKIWQNVYLTYALLKGVVHKFCIVDDNIEKFYDQFLLDLCKSVNIDPSRTRDAIKFGIHRDLMLPEVIFESELAAKALLNPESLRKGSLLKTGRKRKSITSAPMAKSRKRKSTVSAPKAGRKEKRPKKKYLKDGASRGFFFPVVWKALTTQCGWTLDTGNRPNDFYFLPPGIKRGKGFRTRVDFFDSTSQVINFLKTSEKWKGKAEVIECLRLKDKCEKLYKDDKKKKKTVDEIIESAKAA